MRRFFLAFALLLAPMAVTACAGVDFSAPPVPIISAANTTADEKRLYDAELAYGVAVDAYLSAVKNGVLTGPNKATAKSALQTAAKALAVAREARRAANATTFNQQLTSALAAIASAKAFLPAR